jgi:hypothetical protein
VREEFKNILAIDGVPGYLDLYTGSSSSSQASEASSQASEANSQAARGISKAHGSAISQANGGTSRGGMRSQPRSGSGKQLVSAGSEPLWSGKPEGERNKQPGGAESMSVCSENTAADLKKQSDGAGRKQGGSKKGRNGNEKRWGSSKKTFSLSEKQSDGAERKQGSSKKGWNGNKKRSGRSAKRTSGGEGHTVQE